ncbi:TetR/AcrR family transcriptional regulator [Chlorobaculum sp. 24CR]|uniref:TetR/AcrR family transcriptional regulator n=1 Tax=Chlorobaculum sp. 24CR TaxID=2508878 RepID=UPI00100BB415|nr:TetR/AcrR family transcriptional regulator [Chlorobaculum sp. 24CR]RXK88782.1 TetR/AcrR family transcriptional regulator [Chlorobaculum sp. 24CR]
MARPSKKRQLTNLPEIIKEAAWRQITESGASALSLRGIARALGITAPAIYNYFPDRDALVTALIIDAFSSFGDRQLAARDAVAGPSKEIERLRATGLAYRQWALDHPHRYLLIFGNPVPDYIPPMQEVRPVMMRSISALTSTIGELYALGMIDPQGIPLPQVENTQGFCDTMAGGDETMLTVLSVALLIWSRVHGLVSLEITGKLPPFASDGAALYEFELDAIARQFVRPVGA